ncbi:hypothetical protein [Burkholderia vietnamiensis]|uniref:hypothetical protein n=1 Tax=Burkholderia vietnamiensis TaxID=60552 RepID=UPI001CB4EFF5|nr:hypothetical protein [Burkholderia vietnamiensis]CAG9229277.1 conserved hypothetical protein [Burkholderia vietnamiensis]HDR9086292.1 hypothetical protein [Burkholderia vietnamiensis]
MTNLKRIAAYQTTDGRTFDDKDAAKKHQTELDRVGKIEALVKAEFAPGVNNAESFTYLDEVTVGGVALFILNNADALREILPKKAKAAKAQEPAKQETEQGTAPTAAVVPPAIDTCEQRPAADAAEAAAVETQSPAAEFAWPAGLSAALNTTQAAA